MFSYHKIPLESYANKKFIVLFKEGFLVGWSIAMVSVVVVMFRNTLRFLMKKATTKKNKKIKKAVIGAGGARWCFTDERSRNMMVTSLRSCLFLIYVSFVQYMIAKDYFQKEKTTNIFVS